MNLRKVMRIDWRLFFCLSFPPFIYQWLVPREVKGNNWSYLSYVWIWLKETNFSFHHDILEYLFYRLVETALPTILIGWIAQYFVVLAWEFYRERSAAAGGGPLP